MLQNLSTYAHYIYETLQLIKLPIGDLHKELSGKFTVHEI